MLAKAIVAVAAVAGANAINIKNINDAAAKAHIAAEMTKMSSTKAAKKVEKKVYPAIQDQGEWKSDFPKDSAPMSGKQAQAQYDAAHKVWTKEQGEADDALVSS